jgi:hypothetical protein
MIQFFGGFESAICALRKELPSLDIKKRNLYSELRQIWGELEHITTSN